MAVGTGTGVSVAAGSSSHATSIETARRLARPIQAVRRTKSPNAVPARNVDPNGCLFLGYAAYLINCLYPLYDCRNPNGQAEAPAPGCSSCRPARPNAAALWSAHRTMAESSTRFQTSSWPCRSSPLRHVGGSAATPPDACISPLAARHPRSIFSGTAAGCTSLHCRIRIERALSWWPDTFARDRECNG